MDSAAWRRLVLVVNTVQAKPLGLVGTPFSSRRQPVIYLDDLLGDRSPGVPAPRVGICVRPRPAFLGGGHGFGERIDESALIVRRD